MDRLHRISLLLGDAAIEKLKRSTVMIVGCGAVGSFAIEALARSGIGHMVLVDFDVVEESNINRQVFALDSTIGKTKVEVARQRIHDINPDIIVVREILSILIFVISLLRAAPILEINITLLPKHHLYNAIFDFTVSIASITKSGFISIIVSSSKKVL